MMFTAFVFLYLLNLYIASGRAFLLYKKRGRSCVEMMVVMVGHKWFGKYGVA
jgi:hypothetical protein